jgi:hypothetical protein
MMAIGIGVTREAAADRGDAGFGDVGRRVEIRFANRQADDIQPLAPQLRGACGHGKGG